VLSPQIDAFADKDSRLPDVRVGSIATEMGHPPMSVLPPIATEGLALREVLNAMDGQCCAPLDSFACPLVLWVGWGNLWRNERLHSVHDTFRVKSVYFGRRETQHRREDVRGVVAD
jgi:hypothetical protein